MNILWIVPEVPWPPSSIARARSFHVLCLLARRHNLWLLALASPIGRATASTGGPLSRCCRDILVLPPAPGGRLGRAYAGLSQLLRGVPPGLAVASTAALGTRLRPLCARVTFDVVLLDGADMGPCLDALPADLHSRAVWHLHELDWPWRKAGASRRPGPRLRQAWLRAWLPRCAARCAAVTVGSPEQRAQLRGALPCLHPAVIPPAAEPAAAGRNLVSDPVPRERSTQGPHQWVQRVQRCDRIAESLEKLFHRVCRRARQRLQQRPLFPGRPGRPIGHWWLR